ncbi:MAG: hypothetical protein HWN71_06830 [Desulfobacterales bacterium]|nr:hypothetical protein [Desulfobacterales bacterium]
MLRKLPEPEIPADDPFRNDVLNRRENAENVTYLIEGASEPFVLSINSQWGHGKTTFIKMWAQHLENKDHACIYFNWWESDFSENPLVDIASYLRSVD